MKKKNLLMRFWSHDGLWLTINLQNFIVFILYEKWFTMFHCKEIYIDLIIFHDLFKSYLSYRFKVLVKLL